MITEAKVEQALAYIAQHAEPLAEAKALVKYLDHKRKVIRATKFAEFTGTQGERSAYAERHDEYKQCLEEWREAIYDAELISTKMKAAELTISVFQTQQRIQRGPNV